MNEDVRQRIVELIGELHCPKDFLCGEHGFEELCKAKDIGLGNYLECLDPSAVYCKFALRHPEGYFCRCPLRVYLAKHVLSDDPSSGTPCDA